MAGDVPLHWVKYKVAKDTSVARYISDLAARLAQLGTIATTSGTVDGIWLGGLFQPEAFITATRQDIAHQNGCSLEQLVLQLSIEQAPGPGAFAIRGESTQLTTLLSAY